MLFPMKSPSITRLFAPLALCAFLAGCASHPSGSGTSPTTSSGATYKVGQPYQVSGEWYYPHEDYSYDETGIASWYGADFHEQSTANGEIFNKNELTAAHKTLPLPTLARVTNLDNGRSIVVRINDRGPFSGARIIDVSQRAAQLLGFEGQGTAKVRVQVLADESKAIADAMRHYGKGTTEVAANTPYQQTAAVEQPVQEVPAAQTSAASTNSLTSAPVESEVLSPIKTTPETHRELLATKPVAEVVQLPVTGNNQIFVQAGAFTVPENATRLQQSLSRFGATSVSTIVINGKKFYRVRIGPIPDVAHADTLLGKLKQQPGTAGARTVVD
jgi:rare lipoprotein A